MINSGKKRWEYYEKSNNDKIHCGQIIKELALKSSGNGGGSKNYAQGGGTNIEKLGVNLQDIKDYLRSNI